MKKTVAQVSIRLEFRPRGVCYLACRTVGVEAWYVLVKSRDVLLLFLFSSYPSGYRR